MKETAHKKPQGFTLLELLVVLAITAILVAITGAGLAYLQNAVLLDNAIRDIKVEIQSTQNNARNSLVVRPGESTANLGNNNISIGWVFSVANNSSGGVTITRRGVYFQPSGYNIDNLRDDIKSLFVNSSAQAISCTNNLLYKGAGQMKLSGRDIFCAQASDGKDDYGQLNISGINLLDTMSGIPICSPTGSGSGISYNLFFTTGYGESVFNTNTVTACQMGIKSTGIFGASNARAVKVNKDTGSLSICGNYCP